MNFSSEQENLLNFHSEINEEEKSTMLESTVTLTEHLEMNILSNKNSITEKSPENTICKDTLLNDEYFYSQLDKIDAELQVKPIHWTDEYWKDILKRYRWFIVKDDHAGCKICKNVKIFIGKKSLLSYMKLYIMTLSYDEFEHKLAAHNCISQHLKSMDFMKESFNISVRNEAVVHLKTSTALLNVFRYAEYPCPQCGKIYKFKKALVTHIYSCDPKISLICDNLSCNCKKQNLTSLSMCDLHITNFHLNKYRFFCPICSSEFSQITVLFEHLFLKHDYYWNPYEEFPKFKLIDNVLIGRLEISNINGNNLENCNYDSIKDYHNNSSISGSHSFQSEMSLIKRKSKKDPDAKRPMQEMTNYNSSNSRTIDLNSIVFCSICEGRYLSDSVLQTHMERYHPK